MVFSFPATTASGRERPRSMETIHKLRDRTGALSNTVTKLFKRKNYKRKSKELKQPVTMTDGGTDYCTVLEYLILTGSMHV